MQSAISTVRVAQLAMRTEALWMLRTFSDRRPSARIGVADGMLSIRAEACRYSS